MRKMRYEMEQQKKENLGYQFIRYVFLNVISMLGYSVYILADTYFISKGLGADGLAALNIALPVYYMLCGLQMMLAIGGASRFIVYKTQGKQEKGDRVYSQVVEAGLLIGLIYFLLSFILPGPLSRLLGAEGAVYEMTKTYSRVIMMFAPAFVYNQIKNTFVKNDDGPKLAMYANLAGSLFNIIFDYIFIFIFDLGMLGAVLATGTAPLISILIMTAHKKQQTFHFRRMPLEGSVFARVLPLGLPSMINELASAVVMITFNSLLLSLSGDTAVAAYGVILNIYLVVSALFNGIAQGAQPLLGEEYSKGNRKGHRQVYRWALITAFAMSAVFYIMLWLFKTPVVSVFNSEGNAALQALAEGGILLYFTAMPFAGFNMITAMNFVSMQQGLPGQIITLLRGLVIIVPGAILLAWAAGLTGIWIALPVTEALTAAAGAVMLRRSSAKGKSMP